MIDTMIGSLVRSYDAKLRIGASHCPNRIDISRGRTASCTLMVNELPIPIRVTYAGPPQQYHVGLPGSFFEKRVIERGAESYVLQYGIKAVTHCPGPAVSVMTQGTTFTCSLSGSHGPALLKVRVGDNGVLWFSKPAGYNSSPWYDPPLEVAVKRHKSGLRTILAGSFLEHYIDNYLAEESAVQPGAKAAFGHARCPAFVDLTGSRKGSCAVPTFGQNAHYMVWIDDRSGGSFQLQRTDAVVNLSLVGEQAEKGLNQSLEENGFPTRVSIQCGRGFLVVPVPSHFYCNVMIGAEPAKLFVEVQDSRGNVKMRVITKGSK